MRDADLADQVGQHDQAAGQDRDDRQRLALVVGSRSAGRARRPGRGSPIRRSRSRRPRRSELRTSGGWAEQRVRVYPIPPSRSRRTRRSGASTARVAGAAGEGEGRGAFHRRHRRHVGERGRRDGLASPCVVAVVLRLLLERGEFLLSGLDLGLQVLDRSASPARAARPSGRSAPSGRRLPAWLRFAWFSARLRRIFIRSTSRIASSTCAFTVASSFWLYAGWAAGPRRLRPGPSARRSRRTARPAGRASAQAGRRRRVELRASSALLHVVDLAVHGVESSVVGSGRASPVGSAGASVSSFRTWAFKSSNAAGQLFVARAEAAESRVVARGCGLRFRSSASGSETWFDRGVRSSVSGLEAFEVHVVCAGSWLRLRRFGSEPSSPRSRRQVVVPAPPATRRGGRRRRLEAGPGVVRSIGALVVASFRVRRARLVLFGSVVGFDPLLEAVDCGGEFVVRCLERGEALLGRRGLSVGLFRSGGRSRRLSSSCRFLSSATS